MQVESPTRPVQFPPHHPLAINIFHCTPEPLYDWPRCPLAHHPRSTKANKTSPGDCRCSNTIRPNRRSSNGVTNPWNTRELMQAGRCKAFSRLASQKHCRLGAVVALEERSVSSRARCVWLTSRPSWPLEGGRPREVSRSRASVSATRTRPRSVIPSSTLEHGHDNRRSHPARRKMISAGRSRYHTASRPPPREIG